MKNIIIALLLISCSVKGQNIFMDNKDKFTGIRAISTKLENLMPLGAAKVMGVKIIDSAGARYQLGVSNTFYFDVVASKPDSAEKGLWLILDGGSKVYLPWENTAVIDQITINATKMYSSSFNVPKDLVNSLANATITDVRMIGDKGHGLQFEVEKKFRDTIAKILKLLISKN